MGCGKKMSTASCGAFDCAFVASYGYSYAEMLAKKLELSFLGGYFVRNVVFDSKCFPL